MATHKGIQLTYMGVGRLCWGVSSIPGVLGDFKGVLSGLPHCTPMYMISFQPCL